MGRPSNRQERRAEIVFAMMRVMVIKGYEGASIQAIAKEAGLSSGLIHYHFKTKQEILLSSVAQISNVLERRYEQLSESSITAKDKLKAFINARLAKGESSNSQIVAAWVIIGSEAVCQPEVKTVYLRALGVQKQLLNKLITHYYASVKTKAQLSKMNIESKTAFAMAFMEGAFSLSITAHEIMPDNWAAEELMQYLTEAHL